MTQNTSGLINDGFMKDIVETGYKAIDGIETLRKDLMADLKDAATSSSDAANKITIGPGSEKVDISTGAGSLVLDNYLQELSTVEQAAAQIVAQSNKAQKNVHAQTGQV